MRIAPNEARVAPPTPAASHALHAAAPASGTPERSPFATLLHGLGSQINQGEAMMRGAVSAAHDLGPSELIALQAGVYRYSEAIDLASRLVDHAATSLKTVVQGGGQ
ncbi:MAG TPA: hypothetical protein VGG39_17745 [Polyangiaceae bacterium]|jgi:hypothetical protein